MAKEDVVDPDVYDLGEIYDMLGQSGWRPSHTPVLPGIALTDSFDPTLPVNANEMDIDDLQRWCVIYGAWEEYVANQKILIDSMVRSLERQLDLIESQMKVDVWNRTEKKHPPEDIRKAMIHSNRSWVDTDVELSKQESLRAGMLSRLDKLHRAKATVETLIIVRQSQMKHREGA